MAVVELLLPLLYITLPPAAGPMIMLSLGFAILVTAIMYMLAAGLQSPQLSAVAKEELAALLFSAFIISFWLSSDVIFNGLVGGLLQSTLPPSLQANLRPCTFGPNCVQGLTTNHLMLAIGTMDILIQKLKSQYISLYMFEALIGFLSTISFPLGSPVPVLNAISISFAPFTGLTLLSNAHTIVVEAIGYLITVVWAKQFILIFCRDAVPLFILPLGLVLRAFPFWRSTGSSIIALAFALYFVLPFSVILSNYLIFDVYQPSDFAYTPYTASYFSHDKSAADIQQQMLEGRDAATKDLVDTFSAPDAAQKASTEGACSGNAVVNFLCSPVNMLKNLGSKFLSFAGTVWHIWRFMMGMTGDFFTTAFNNPLLPSSSSAGLYYFIIKEVTNVSQFMILVSVTTVVEIIITVTMYRNISLVLGGEAELIGMTKIV